MNTNIIGTGLTLNITVCLTTSINIDDSHAAIPSIYIIKKQITKAFESIINNVDYDEECNALLICDVKYLIEIDREGAVYFKTIQGSHPLINSTLANSLTPYIDDWKSSPPAPWKESISFRVTTTLN